MRIPSGVTDQYVYFVAVDATDFTSRETGLSSFTVYRSRNGAASSVMTTPTINETDITNMPGVYELLLDEDMTITAGNDSEELVFHITHAGMAPVTRSLELYRPKFTAGATLALTDINAECDTAIGDAALATAANLATVDTVVDGIQTDLDNATDGLGAIKAETALIVADTNELQTDDVPGLIATLDAVVDTVKAETVLIVADTNELQTDWADGGRLDTILDSAASAGDPWITALPGAYGAGTAGQIIGDNINAPLDTIDTVVDGIQTDLSNATDGLGAIKAETALIVADTNELQADDVPGLIAALNDISTADVNAQCDTAISDAALATAAALSTVDTVVDGIQTDLDNGTDGLGALLAAINGQEDISEANVLTQVNAALDTAISELGVASPTATPTMRTGLMLLYMALRNQRTTTATVDTIKNDAGTTIASASVSDDTTTFTKNEYS